MNAFVVETFFLIHDDIRYHNENSQLELFAVVT